MTVLADTSLFAWTIDHDASKTPKQKMVDAMAGASTLFVSTVSIFEIGQKVRAGKWPEMRPYAKCLDDLARKMDFTVVPLSAKAATQAALMDWDNRDPFDRMIVGEAIRLNARVATMDRRFATIPFEWPGLVA